MRPHGPRARLRKWLPFAKCDDCVHYRAKINRTKDGKERWLLRREYRAHLKFVRRERESYYARRRLAFLYPDEYMSLIVDGADQALFRLPYISDKSKTTDGAYKCKTHLFGAISHGRKAYCYTVTDSVKLGHNATIDVIHRVLMDTLETEGKLPRKLLLQLDNTTKQCKGKYLLAYAAALVDAGVFEKVQISHLPVGHTHEDIDQLFSRISVILRRKDAYDFKMLSDNAGTVQWKAGYPPVVTGHLDNIANFSDWVKPLIKAKSELAGVMSYYSFRVFRKLGTLGEAVVQAKTWPGDKELYSGLQPDISNYTKIFVDEHCAALKPSTLPKSQRTETWTDTFKNKMVSGVKKIQALVEFPMIHLSSLYVEIDACSAPQTVSKGCSWDPILHDRVMATTPPDKLMALRQECQGASCGRRVLEEAAEDPCLEAYDNVDLGHADDVELAAMAERQELVEAGLDDEEIIPRITPSKGSFYLLRPPEGNPDLYLVGEVKKIEKDANGFDVVRMLYWDYEVAYGSMREHTKYRFLAELDHVYWEALEFGLNNLVVAPGSNGNRSRAMKFNEHDVPKVKKWAELWKDQQANGGMEYQDEELARMSSVNSNFHPS